MTAARLHGLPPGRAGRTWLHRRLATAQRGQEQLDRKLRILVPERQRLVALLDRQRKDWFAACDEASSWATRAALLGGEDALRLAQSLASVTVHVRWVTVIGVAYPAEVRVQRMPAGSEPIWSNAAVAPAHAAAWQAVEAGARLAATNEALRRLDSEIDLTRRRLRALDQRWMPRLSEALHDLGLILEQAEQEDGVRLRQRLRSENRSRSEP